MSFWSHLKPSNAPPRASAVELSADRRELHLTWSDGLKSALRSHALRLACPCAECVEEWTGRKLLDPAKVSAEVTIGEVTGIGNYALGFSFSDHHRTGIYNWEYLRSLSVPAGP